ncbi:MAG: hypothetical protein KAI94_00905 [Anaerolineales bacterium]|nr:hypothetical protein [Anaerolineales bacterium]
MNKRRLYALSIALLCVLLVAGAAWAAPQAFDLSWWTVDGGGGTSSSGDFALSGTIGQPDTSPLMSGGDFTIVGGYWGGGALLAQNQLYLPIVTR